MTRPKRKNKKHQHYLILHDDMFKFAKKLKLDKLFDIHRSKKNKINKNKFLIDRPFWWAITLDKVVIKNLAKELCTMIFNKTCHFHPTDENKILLPIIEQLKERIKQNKGYIKQEGKDE
jgi:hypothetical protein